MKLSYNVDARKRAVNLTLNEDLLAHVREVTENLSSVSSRCSQNTWQGKAAPSGPSQDRRVHCRVVESVRRRERLLCRRSFHPLMAQFDVHRNPGRHRGQDPLVVIVQSTLYDDYRRRVVVPLVDKSSLERLPIRASIRLFASRAGRSSCTLFLHESTRSPRFSWQRKRFRAGAGRPTGP